MPKFTTYAIGLYAMLFALFSCEKTEKDLIMHPNELKIDPRAQINYLENFVGQNPNQDAIHFRLAGLYYVNGDIENSLSHVNKAIAINKKENKYLFLQAQCFVSKRLFLDAKDAFEQVSEKGLPKNEYISLAADIYYNTNNFARALSYLDRATVEIPNSPFLYYKKGVIFQSKGDTVKAIENYSRSIVLNPAYTEAYIQWAELENKRGNYQSVKTYLLNALRYDTLNSTLYFHLAIAYKMLGIKDSSSLLYEKAIQFDSNYTDALYNLAILYLQQKKYAPAEKYLKRVAYLKPQIPNLNYKIAYALDFQNKYAEALNYYEKIDSSDISYNFAQTLIKKIQLKYKKTAVVEQEME